MNNFCGRTRAKFLWEAGAGFTGVALTPFWTATGSSAARPARNGVAQALARQTLSLCLRLFGKGQTLHLPVMYGGPSQMDLFDYKPRIAERHGQSVNVEVRRGLIQKQT